MPSVEMSTTERGGVKRPRTDSGGLSPPPVKRKQQASINQEKAVANFFKPASEKEKEPEKISWRTVNKSLLVGKYSSNQMMGDGVEKPDKRRIVAFDFDSTLISTVSALRFARDAADWKWWHGSVPSTLRRLHGEGHLLVVLSNQAGIELHPDVKHSKRLKDFKQRSTAVLTQLDLPMAIYAATAHDKYRKPRTDMWTQMLEDHDLKHEDVDHGNSIFVGDAGGRIQNGKLRKDFSCSDRDFADNVGIRYQSPEEFFLNEEPRPFLRDFDPAQYLTSPKAQQDDGSNKATSYAKINDIDIVLLCGSPGAGKSTFYWNALKPLGYERVNQDILKSRERCLKVAADFIQEKRGVVIDNTNADPETRESWVKLARRFNVPIRCILFTASANLCMHNDVVRALNAEAQGLNPEERVMLPRVAFTGFASRYKEPQLGEGFQDIIKVDFTYQGTEEQRLIWSKYWT